MFRTILSSSTTCNLTFHYPHFYLNQSSPFSTHHKTLIHSPNYPPCKATHSNNNDTPNPNPNTKKTRRPKLDRRGFLLIGFGSTGVYTVSNLKPLSPDFSNCVDIITPDGRPIDCCPKLQPPPPAEITDFASPLAVGPTRVRRPAHSAANMAKYKKAIELMKKLPSSDPRNFTQQANVHCVYCDGGYNQDGFTNRKFEIHQSWLFFPFHRWYLYFFERICARLLGDDESFALPFWNWDSPSGMEIPAVFDVVGSPLYDRRRDPDHLPPAVADLNWDGFPTGITPETQMKYNLNIMYKQMITNGTTPTLFMGQPYKSGDDITTLLGAGSIENAPHNTLHTWTGDPNEPNTENMGIFYSAARDPIFYPHHANVDRLWTVWVNKLNGKLFTDPDWLQTSFVFYDEDKKAVRVTIEDCLDLSRLGYTYEDVDIPWIYAEPRPRRKREIRSCYIAREVDQIWPRKLDGVLNVVVRRTRRLRSEEEKEDEEEVLVIDEIEYDRGEYVKFDVYVNEEDVGLSTPGNTEFLGSFVNVPRGRGRDGDGDGDRTVIRGSQRFGISGVLEELGEDGSEVVLVTLVPRSGCVVIGGVKIEFDASKSCA